MKKAVLILGCMPFEGHKALPEGCEFEIWCINNYAHLNPPHAVSRWFQLHSFAHMTKAHGEEYIRQLFALDVPLVLFPREAETWRERADKIGYEGPSPRIMPYPVEDALALAGRPYFDTSFALMIALAVLEGFEKICLAGVSFGAEQGRLWLSRRIAASVVEAVASGDKRWTRELREGPLVNANKIVNELRGQLSGDESWAVPCISYHLGIARGRGIETFVFGEESGLFSNKWGEGALYGMDERAGGE